MAQRYLDSLKFANSAKLVLNEKRRCVGVSNRFNSLLKAILFEGKTDKDLPFSKKREIVNFLDNTQKFGLYKISKSVNFTTGTRFFEIVGDYFEGYTEIQIFDVTSEVRQKHAFRRVRYMNIKLATPILIGMLTLFSFVNAIMNIIESNKSEATISRTMNLIEKQSLLIDKQIKLIQFQQGFLNKQDSILRDNFLIYE